MTGPLTGPPTGPLSGPDPARGVLVVESWRPWLHTGPRGGYRPPVVLVDGDVVLTGLGTARVTVEPGVHTVTAGLTGDPVTVRVRVGAGDEVHVEHVASHDVRGGGRFVPPGGRPAGRTPGIAFVLAGLAAVGVVAAVRAAAGGLPAGAGAVLLVLVWAGLHEAARRRPRGPLRAVAPAGTAARRAATLAALDPPWRPADPVPAQARWLGDAPAALPAPGPGTAGIVVGLAVRPWPWTTPPPPPAGEVTSDWSPRVEVDGVPQPASWSTWWYPVEPGPHTVSVLGPAAATAVVDVAAGQVVRLWYRGWVLGREDGPGGVLRAVPGRSAATFGDRADAPLPPAPVR